jgi:hypothetical protein
MVEKRRNDNRLEWRMNVPFMLMEHPNHSTLAWNASKCVDLILIRLTGGVPKGNKK